MIPLGSRRDASSFCARFVFLYEPYNKRFLGKSQKEKKNPFYPLRKNNITEPLPLTLSRKDYEPEGWGGGIDRAGERTQTTNIDGDGGNDELPNASPLPLLM